MHDPSYNELNDRQQHMISVTQIPLQDQTTTDLQQPLSPNSSNGPNHDSAAALNKDFQSFTSLAKLKQPDLGNAIDDSKIKLGQELGLPVSNRSQ